MQRFFRIYPATKTSLRRSPNDLSQDNYDSRDMEALERHVHTLKGLTANLGIEPLCKLSAEYLEQIRNAVPSSELTNYQRQLTQEYRRVTQSITQFLSEQNG